MRLLQNATLLTLLAALLAPAATAGEVFSLPPDPIGGVNTSSWVAPDGTDSDTYAWEDFTMAETQTITEVRWRGGYASGAPYGHVYDFKVSFFDSNVTGFEPLITALPEKESQETVIATFHTGSACGESYVGFFGGKAMYDYTYTLPTPVTIPANTKCWFRVVGVQHTWPDWGMASGMGGNGANFKFSTGTSMFQSWPHDLSFSLHAAWENLGGGLAGAAGIPKLGSDGSLLSLGSAATSSQAFFVGGLSQVNLPLAGGILVPDPLVIVPVGTSSTGKASLPFVKPTTLPAGLDVVIQAWVLDPAAPQGLSASNTIFG